MHNASRRYICDAVIDVDKSIYMPNHRIGVYIHIRRRENSFPVDGAAQKWGSTSNTHNIATTSRFALMMTTNISYMRCGERKYARYVCVLCAMYLSWSQQQHIYGYAVYAAACDVWCLVRLYIYLYIYGLGKICARGVARKCANERAHLRISDLGMVRAHRMLMMMMATKSVVIRATDTRLAGIDGKKYICIYGLYPI